MAKTANGPTLRARSTRLSPLVSFFVVALFFSLALAKAIPPWAVCVCGLFLLNCLIFRLFVHGAAMVASAREMNGLCFGAVMGSPWPAVRQRPWRTIRTSAHGNDQHVIGLLFPVQSFFFSPAQTPGPPGS
ncbi:hypothetical protein [Pandoravirus japonicus]|uniref:Uncharacterized protein n=1 Tax=Pandoravirus japonicus TaxID=2823154 RepID=A0A811BS72_9VIRU|nr:hypothetical protein [Pandoravirus japonicus]